MYIKYLPFLLLAASPSFAASPEEIKETKSSAASAAPASAASAAPASAASAAPASAASSLAEETPAPTRLRWSDSGYLCFVGNPTPAGFNTINHYLYRGEFFKIFPTAESFNKICPDVNYDSVTFPPGYEGDGCSFRIDVAPR